MKRVAKVWKNEKYSLLINLFALVISFMVSGISSYLIIKLVNISSMGAIVFGNLLGLIVQSPLDRGHHIQSIPIIGGLDFEESRNYYASTLRKKIKGILFGILFLLIVLLLIPGKDHRILILTSFTSTVLLILSSDSFFIMKRMYRTYFWTNLFLRTIFGVIGIVGLLVSQSAIFFAITTLIFSTLNVFIGFVILKINRVDHQKLPKVSNRQSNLITWFRITDDLMSLLPGIVLGIVFPLIQNSYSIIERLLRMLATIPGVVQSSLTPWIFEKRHPLQSRGFVALKLMNAVALAFTLILALFLPQIIDVYSSGKLSISPSLGILSALFVFSLVSAKALLLIYALPELNTYWLVKTNIICALIFILSISFLGNRFGYGGSLFGVCVTQFLYNVTLYVYFFRSGKQESVHVV